METEIDTPTDQPKEARRFICTSSMPYQKSYPKGSRWMHPDSTHVRDDYGSLASGGSYEERHCPVCDLDFTVTLPD